MKKNIAWNTFGSIFYCVCQWLITVLVVWLDSYSAAGNLSLAMTTSSSFSAISLFSMRNYPGPDHSRGGSKIYIPNPRAGKHLGGSADYTSPLSDIGGCPNTYQR